MRYSTSMIADGARPHAFDAIVVGLGGMGSAVAAHAALRGMRVLGLEQFGEGHDLGASSGRSRIIRKAYFEAPEYVPLLLRAYELWSELERAGGVDIVRRTGMVMVGTSASAVLAGTRASARLHGLALEELSARQLAERYPLFSLRANETALFEADAGFVRPEAAIASHLSLARAAGATIHFGAVMRSWEVVAGGIVVTLETGERIAARRLALCLGPWFEREMAVLGVPLRIQRNVQVWFRPDHGAFDAAHLPVFLADRPGDPAPLYGFPDLGDGLGLKAAFHGFGETTDPGDLRRDVDAGEIAGLRRALDALVPGAAGEALAAKACMYSSTPDEHFVIAPHPAADHVVIAGGFSGHGFKFCSVVGEIVTDLLETGATRHDIGFVSPGRFAKPRTSASTICSAGPSISPAKG